MSQKLKMTIRRFSSTNEEWVLKRQKSKIFDDSLLKASVKKIIETVRKKGDRALLSFTKKYDQVDLSERGIIINKFELKNAYDKVNKEQINALLYLKARISKIERSNLKKFTFSIKDQGLNRCHVLKPISSVGCYIPGGTAIYPSTLLMSTIPAKIAGVPRIAICSPPSFHGTIHPITLVAADICGVDEVYQVGGAHAIAALAYGTESIDPVLKIVGPGNKIVTLAKMIVSRDIAIDFPAGPSEIIILADETADPRFIALDMISQSEHSTECIAGLITTSMSLAQKVVEEVENLVKVIDRKKIVIQSLSQNGFILVCENMNEAIDFVNAYAPEHLQIVTRTPFKLAKKINSAGVILLGPYTPVSGSDYCYGTNHILPTSSFSFVHSGLSILDFVKRINILKCSKQRLSEFEKVVRIFALSEGLPNHFLALKGRFRN